MIQDSNNTCSKLNRQILDYCKHIAGPHQIAAVCQSDDYTIEVPSPKSTVEVLIVIRDFQPRLMSYVRIIDGRNVVFFAVDQWIFERDVDRGFLGEALARLLIFPYASLANADYLQLQEVKLKKRLVLELLENMVLSYPEFSYSMHIKPEYFMYEVMLSRVRVFPPMAYGVSNFLSGDADKDKVDFVISGYIEALKQLEKEAFIQYLNGEVMMSTAFVDASKNPRVRFINTIKNAPRALFSSLFGVFPQLLNFLSQNAEAFFRFQMLPWRNEFDFEKFVNPQKYVFVPTAQGLVSLADKVDIRGYVKKVLSANFDKIEVKEFGGFLNDVYLIRACTDHSEKKVLVKRFKDLSSFKWFPLSMWSVGARSFALLGKSRLERECAINGFLSSQGFNVPQIFHVSANERLVFMEFLEGEDLSNVIKRIAKVHDNEAVDPELNLIAQVGEIYAKVHALGVVLGDTKPDNVMVDSIGRLFLLDFEQASRSGDKAWDVAEFLYYAGHYLPLNGERKAEAVVNAFIAGYLSAGGDVDVIKAAALPKYTRVFSIFTLPGILFAMAAVCRKTEPRQ